MTLVTTVVTLLLCRRCGIDTDGALARGHRREVEGVLVRQLVEVHLRVDEVLVVDVLGDHTLHVAMLVLEALECTLHHEVLDGDLRCVDFSDGCEKVQLPLTWIAMVLEVGHHVHSVESARTRCEPHVLPHRDNTECVSCVIAPERSEHISHRTTYTREECVVQGLVQLTS